ncbi:hypothetical protein CKG91_20110 [Salmonella enterica]|nr:hypothetical protein [Salmonella enterica]EDQ1202021.1 hypothetical protein [Salmonella enterica subsp. enterica serovar Ohio]EAQ2673746.1 hypothetical protein [Salmonella enterica]EAS0605685.1 hypothetical protein [Salmonella enterica]EAU9122982.1 hypothetical protein [Salmonella enterica]
MKSRAQHTGPRIGPTSRQNKPRPNGRCKWVEGLDLLVDGSPVDSEGKLESGPISEWRLWPRFLLFTAPYNGAMIFLNYLERRLCSQPNVSGADVPMIMLVLKMVNRVAGFA